MRELSLMTASDLLFIVTSVGDRGEQRIVERIDNLDFHVPGKVSNALRVS